MLKELFFKPLKSAKFFLFACGENNYRAGIFQGNALLYVLFGALILKLFVISFLVYFPRNSFFAEITKTSLINLANAERKNQGLIPLKENPVLDRAAYLKAQDMLYNGYFAHVSPAGINPWYWFKKSGYNYKFAGENLAIGFLDSSEVHDAWIDSPSHKANILNNKYKEVGIAVLKGNFQGNDATIVVQLFGTKQPVYFGKTVTPQTGSAATPAKKKDVSKALPPYETVLGAADSRESFAFGFFSFIAEKYSDLIQKVIYFSLIGIIFLLFANLALKFDLEHKDLLIKAAGFIFLLMLFVSLDKGSLLKLIPHSLFVY